MQLGLLKPIRDYVDALVHPSALNDALTASRHRAFIAPRLIGSVVALAAFPLYIVARGVPSSLEVIVFAWLVLPILTAYYLSRTGQYESAHLLSSLALTGLVTAVAAETGGIASFAAIWLVVVPLEAALSASRRVVALASTFALVAAGLLHLLGHQGRPEPRRPAPWRRSASSRRRSMPRVSRSAPSRSPGRASGCCTPRRIATACSPAT
jgi:cell cycle sensor histidine kinase DivJ